jgi:hypothetical protein
VLHARAGCLACQTAATTFIENISNICSKSKKAADFQAKSSTCTGQPSARGGLRRAGEVLL